MMAGHVAGRQDLARGTPTLFFAMVAIAAMCAGCVNLTLPPPSARTAIVTAPPVRAVCTDPGAIERRAEIEQLIAGGFDSSIARSSAERDQLLTLYRRNGYAPLWIDPLCRLSQRGRAALTLVSAAADDGLEPADYDVPALSRLAAALDRSTASPDLARFDVGLSASLLRYLRDLHVGRLDPRAIGFRLQVPTDEHDYAGLVEAAIASGQFEEVAVGLRPQHPVYDSLRASLKRYRALATDLTLAVPPRPPGSLHAGQQYAGTPALSHLLLSFGDLSLDQNLSAEPLTYEGPIVDAVKRFQTRHGLDADGVIGAATMEALEMPLAWRARQIELALERLRWLPHDDVGRLVLVNIPMYRLWAWDSIVSCGTPVLATDVIVGKALSTQTPVFVERLQEVVFRPYWNVPASILRNEIGPKLRHDPNYLQKHDMEIVTSDGRVVAPADNLARVGRGLGVRQRPGYRNALGLIKFAFPNQENVYMHDTPAQELFSRSRRDFSHGCVRVRDPVGLAEWTLAGLPEWDRDRILSAMTGTRTIHVKVPRSTHVILFYTTAMAWPEDGTLHFAEDIYRHDARLDRALSAQHAVERP